MQAARFSTLILAACLAAAGSNADAAAAPAGPSACVRGLAALDEGGRVVFETVALLTGTPGVATAPLHPLERGGVRWSRLELREADGSAATPVDSVRLRPGQDLALLRVAGRDACAAVPSEAAADVPTAGTAVRLFRERRGFRPATIGGRIERVVDLAGGGRVALVHLLDDGGSDPGLVVDQSGRFLGATTPPPSGADPSLATVVLAPAAATAPDAEGGGWSPVRETIATHPVPGLLSTTPGLVGQALVLGGEGRLRGIALLSDAIARDEEVAALHVERGVLEFGAGMLPAATADFERAGRLDPGSPLALYNLGVSLGAAGRYADAAQAFRRARDLDPGHARTRYQLALTLKVLHQEAEAREEYHDLLALDPALAGDLRSLIGP